VSLALSLKRRYTVSAGLVSQPPPTVTNLQIDNGAAQRSMIRSLTITFSEAVTFPAR